MKVKEEPWSLMTISKLWAPLEILGRPFDSLRPQLRAPVAEMKGFEHWRGLEAVAVSARVVVE